VVHVTFEWMTPERRPDHYLGLDRGIYNLAAYAVVSENGVELTKGRISGRELRHVQRQEENASRGKSARGVAKRRAWADEAVHVTANKIVELAVEQNARVVVEDLSPLSAIRRRTRIKGSRRGGFNRLLNRVQYEKLKSVLLYKLGEYGLPKPVEVRAAYTSITCPECGHVSKDHRLKIAADDGFEMEEFKCVECGQARVPHAGGGVPLEQNPPSCWSRQRQSVDLGGWKRSKRDHIMSPMEPSGTVEASYRYGEAHCPIAGGPLAIGNHGILGDLSRN
jgi:putative transposase